MTSWYLLYCKRSEQSRAEQHLIRQGVDCYHPQVTVNKIRRGKCSAEKEPLFPNYLFVSFDSEMISFTTVRSTRGVADFVRQGITPCKVSNELIFSLMSHEDSLAQQCQLSEAFQAGQRIEIVAGQFEGAEAIYKEPDGEKRSILLIKLINQQVEVSADNTALRKK